MNFPYFGVDKINLVFLMCLRHQRQIRDLFVMSKSRPRTFSAVPRKNFKRAGIVLSVDNNDNNGFVSVCFSFNRTNKQIIEDKDSENTKKYQSNQAFFLGLSE